MSGCAAVAVVALVLAAEPQCPTGPASCEAELGGSLSEAIVAVSCNTTVHMAHDYCYVKCPMRLVITDPPELRTWMCAIDNSFEPYAPDAHIDLYHPLNNQELELEAVGHPDVGSTRRGCDAADYAWGNKTVAGKIALVRRGGCNYDTKAVQAQAAQAAMLFVVDYWPYYTWRTISGSTAGVETFPLLFAARHEADYVLAALDRGVKVKGKFQYQCNDMPEGYLDNPQDYPWDSCSHSSVALHDTCLEEGAAEPLCQVCTVELQLPGAEKLCLFGNNLRPRKKETLMHTSWDMPYTAQRDEVVYATELANKGCSVSDYVGLAGKILLVPETGRCTLVMTVRSAQEAGVKAYILVTSTWYLQWYRIRAYSHHVHIPVHTVDYHATPKLQAFVSNGSGRHIPGSGFALDAITFTRGVPLPTDPPTPAPLPPIVVETKPHLDTSPDFELSVGMVACIVVACVDVVVLAWLFVRQRREAVQLPEEVRVKTFSIPLKVASMGLSLTLLLLIAIVTFSLATVAGQESTDKAIDNGRAALGLAYDSSEKNTVDLSDTIRRKEIDRVLVLLQKEIFNMEYKLKVVQDMFFGFNGSWAEFDARFVTLMRLQRNVDASVEAVRLAVFTTRGFFGNQDYKTDDRPDELRKDGVTGSVAETQEGWRYGVNAWVENYVTREFHYGWTVPHYQENASRMLAGNIGDPIAVTAGQPLGHTTWMAGRLTFPMRMQQYLPMAAFRPLYGGEGQYHGTIKVLVELSAFIANVLTPSVQSTAASDVVISAGIMQNMSVVVVDMADKAILGGHNIQTWSAKVVGFASVDIISPFYGLHYMHSHPSVKVTALANYLDSVDGWAEHEGEFDEKEHFSEQPHLTLAKVGVSGGRAADTGVHNWDVEMRGGGCGACVAFDAQLQKEVLVFDGATTLHIYRNMTRRTPIVAQSRVSGPGEPWRSSYEAFADTLTHSDGIECVANTWHATATESEKRCLLRPDLSAEASYTVSMRIRPDVAYTETTPHATTPRLFSDSLLGEANIRLFANGQLYLYVLRYGCRTKAYKGGFPVHAWTTVTVVVGEGFCRVYVNGTEHDRGADTRNHLVVGESFYFQRHDVRIHANPYLTGMHFEGRIDSVQLFRHRLRSREVVSLHTQDRLVQSVRHKQFFAQAKTLDMNRELRAGVNWIVAVVIPRDDIMRVVDANRRSTLAAVQIEEDNTNKELAQRANATIMVIVAIAATSVVVFMVFNNMLTRPFEETAAIMAQAAVMRLDSVPQGTSLITELGAMNTAIQLMLENLRLYKSFMPQSVQLDDNADSILDVANLSQCERSFTQSIDSNSSGSSTQGSSSCASGAMALTQKRQMQCSLGRKKFTYAVMNVRGWHAAIKSSSDDAAISLHALMVDIVLHNFLKYKGVSEMFSGDRFTCSFNAARLAAQHKLLACLCLLQCSTELAELPLATSAAAVSGEGRVGNIGSAVMRRFSFLTPVITWGHALERFSCTLDAGNVIDPAVYSDTDLTLTLRIVDVVLFPKMSNMPIVVRQLVGPKDTGSGGEWMYELDHAGRNDPMRAWNECASSIIRGEFADTEAMADAVTKAPHVASRLAKCYQARLCEPVVITFH